MRKLPHDDAPNDGTLSEAAVVSGIATELLGSAHTPQEIRTIISAAAYRVSGAAAAIATAYVPERKAVRLSHFEGLDPLIAFARRLGLAQLTETEVPLSAMTDEEMRNFTSGRLYRLQGGLYALSARVLAPWICTLVEKTFGLGSFWTMGFSWQGRLYGGITLFMRADAPVPHATLVEAIANLGAVALQAAQADEERARLREQLLQSQKMEAVGRLAAGIAHDFNNLLTVITGTSEMMAERMPKDLPFAAEVDHIREAARRASELTRQLLSFSRREMEQPCVIRAREAMDGMAALLRRVIGEDIRLEIDSRSDACFRMDPSQLTQVMLNLATNARDAMPDGGALRVAVRPETVDEERARSLALETGRRYLAISVEDSGTGMGAGTLSHLFEPFFTTKEEGKGTGLGLSTVYGIVRRAGGAVSVQSRQGEGTLVAIILPEAACPAAPLPRPAEAASVPGSAAILLVEDDELVRRYVSRLLVRNGYVVHEARDGAEALRVVHGLSPVPALMITDLVMPGMNGRELAERMRAELAPLAVLFISGYSDDAVVRQGLAEGTLDFLRKPFASKELLSRVASLLGARGD